MIQQREEDERHRQRHVEIGVGAAEEWLIDGEAVRRLVAPADGADSRDQPHPVGGENEDEDRAEEPERPLHEMLADDAFEQTVETLDQPLEKVLRPAGHLRHPARRDLSEDDEADGDEPRDHHRVGDRKTEGPPDFDGLLRDPVRHRFRQREDDRGERAHGVTPRSTAHAMAGRCAVARRHANSRVSRRAARSSARRRRGDILRHTGCSPRCRRSAARGPRDPITASSSRDEDVSMPGPGCVRPSTTTAASS